MASAIFVVTDVLYDFTCAVVMAVLAGFGFTLLVRVAGHPAS
jgi:hypothetical protein